jgi:hypothetical protein
VFEYVESARQTDDLPPGPGYSLRDAALALARRGEVDVFEALHVE